jgi:small subunit ribosomal protein S5
MDTSTKVQKKDTTKKKFGRRKGRQRQQRTAPEFEQKILDLSRVTRVMAGGKRMSFRACVAIGDRKGRVAVGIAKGIDVTVAINKAVAQAKKDMIKVPVVKGTIPHEVKIKNGASKLFFKPAPQGTGVKAGGVVRMILELAGVPNISAKILGTTNKINNAKTAIEALRSFKMVEAAPKKAKKVAPKKTTAKKATAKKAAPKKAAAPKKKATKAEAAK